MRLSVFSKTLPRPECGCLSTIDSLSIDQIPNNGVIDLKASAATGDSYS